MTSRRIYPLYGATGEVLASKSQGCSVAPGWPAESSYCYGSIAPGIACVVPSIGDWAYLQPTEINDPEDWWDPDEHLPVACIEITEQFAKGVELSELDKMLFEDAAAADAIRALRLNKAGWFLDPALSETIFVDGRGSLLRRMGAYRMLCHDEDAKRSMPGISECYWLEPIDFGQKARFWKHRAKPTQLQTIFSLVRKHRAAQSSSLEIALDAFNRSYGCQLRISQRLMLLSIATEALIDPWPSLAKIEECVKRVQSTLTDAGVDDSISVSNWICTTLREARNAVAHGREPELATNELNKLSNVLRSLLLNALALQ